MTWNELYVKELQRLQISLPKLLELAKEAPEEAFSSLFENRLDLSVVVCIITIVSTYILGLVTRNYSWVDRIWSIIPVVYAAIFATTPRTMMMFVLAFIWGVRLTFNFARKGGYSISGEDYRWAYVRTWFPNLFLWELFHFGFICAYQNVLLWLLIVPSYAASLSKEELRMSDYVLTAVFLVLLTCETIADEQQWDFHQRKYAASPKRGVKDLDVKRGFLTKGLFAYSRHPNFFCEFSMWFVFYGYSVTATNDLLNYSLVGSVLLFLLFQGSTWLTEKISSEKYPQYKKYSNSTSRLIPWFPGKALD